MPKIKTRVTFDKKAAAARIRAVANDALTVMGNQAVKDVEQYVPKDQGTLQSSGLARSSREAENMKFDLRWSMPYAQYLWHGHPMTGNPTNRDYDKSRSFKFTSDLARAEWAKYAKEVHGEDWKKVYQAALKEGLK